MLQCFHIIFVYETFICPKHFGDYFSNETTVIRSRAFYLHWEKAYRITFIYYVITKICDCLLIMLSFFNGSGLRTINSNSNRIVSLLYRKILYMVCQCQYTFVGRYNFCFLFTQKCVDFLDRFFFPRH